MPNSISHNFRKRQPRVLYLEFLFHGSFNLEFQEFLAEWFAFPKFNNFQIFRKLCEEISEPSAARFKSSEIFLLNGMRP